MAQSFGSWLRTHKLLVAVVLVGSLFGGQLDRLGWYDAAWAWLNAPAREPSGSYHCLRENATHELCVWVGETRSDGRNALIRRIP